MTSTLQTPTAPTPTSPGRPRRIKRGIVAGYIHEISPRHTATLAAPAAAAPRRRPA
jgi:hypothetical protein